MSLIKFIHESIKYLCLCFLSMIQSFNYLNYIPFMIIFLREIKNIDINDNIFILIYFISYEIAKFFSSGLTMRINGLIGDHFYYSLSICILSVINLIFSLISFSYFNIYVLVTHRILISLSNNIASNIDLPLSLFYSKKQIIFKKRNFSFIQKLTNFLFFFFYLLFFNALKKFYIFCFLISVLNLFGFIISLIIISCHKENLYDRYIPNLSEKEIENSIIKTSQKSKIDNKNNEIVVDIYNNNSISNNNMSTGIQNVENLINENKNKANSNLIYNESIKNDVKSMDISNKNKPKINSSIFKGIISPKFRDNQDKNSYRNSNKILINLIIVLILSKSLIFFILYMLLFKVNEIKILSFVDENNYELLFSNFSSLFKLNSIEEEYIFIFMCYYFLNIFQYFINLAYTSISYKKKIINYIFYYLSLIIILISSLVFTYYYSQKFMNTKISIKKIRRGIIICFIINFLINECIMIMSVFYNIFGKKKGFSESLLKDMKTLSIFLASLIFSIIQSIIIIVDNKSNYRFGNFIYYFIFCLFIIIIFLISILFLNY